MRRLLAILGAVGMVVAAILVRRDLDHGGGDGDRPRTGDGDVVLVCATDLLEYCDALGDGFEVRGQVAAATAAAISEGTLPDDMDGWITTTAWVEVVESRAPDSLGDPEALASSPAVIATANGRFDAITELCTGEDVWACLGDAAGRSWADLGAGDPTWGDLKVGLTDPDSAIGLSVLASASTGFFDGVEFAANDFSQFEDWLATLAEPSASGDPDAARTLAVQGGARYSAAGSVTAVVEDLTESRGVRSIEPSIQAAATVVAVSLHGAKLPSVNAVRDALADDGWDGATTDDLAPTLKPGVMAALHTLWRDVTT